MYWYIGLMKPSTIIAIVQRVKPTKDIESLFKVGIGESDLFINIAFTTSK
jgi:hypothetical protein